MWALGGLKGILGDLKTDEVQAVRTMEVDAFPIYWDPKTKPIWQMRERDETLNRILLADARVREA